MPIMAPHAVVLLMMLGVWVSCGGGTEVTTVAGRALEIHVSSPRFAEKVAFLDDRGGHRVIRPTASNRRLALVNVTVVNWMSTVVHLSIDGDAAQLGDRRGERVGALDPFKAGQGAGVPDPEEGEYLPFLWGAVELKRDYQVSGWMVFDVPERLRLASLWWNESEPMVVDYVEY